MEESQYYILYNDGTKSMPHSLDELSCIENITKETLIIKDNAAPKPAAAFIDFTDNRQTRLPEELNTLNFGACLLAPLWGYNNLPKYKVYWGIYIIIILLSFLIVEYFGWLGWKLFIHIAILCIPASVISFICLIKGNEMAWKNRKFKNIEQFKKIQKKWNIWGYCLFGLYIWIIYMKDYISCFVNY